MIHQFDAKGNRHRLIMGPNQVGEWYPRRSDACYWDVKASWDDPRFEQRGYIEDEAGQFLSHR